MIQLLYSAGTFLRRARRAGDTRSNEEVFGDILSPLDAKRICDLFERWPS